MIDVVKIQDATSTLVYRVTGNRAPTKTGEYVQVTPDHTGTLRLDCIQAMVQDKCEVALWWKVGKTYQLICPVHGKTKIDVMNNAFPAPADSDGHVYLTMLPSPDSKPFLFTLILSFDKR